MPFNHTPLNPDTRHRLKTKNQMGFAHLSPLKITQQLYCQAIQEKGIYADIGAAYGTDTLKLLQAGAQHVTAIDLQADHLQFLKEYMDSETRDRLDIRCQRFPSECQLKSAYYDAILLSRVLIFLTPQEVSLAFNTLYQALKPEGKAYIITLSPFSQNWQAVRALFENHHQTFPHTPFLISNLWEILPFTRSFLPSSIQVFDQASLTYQLEQARFKVLDCGYETHSGSVDTYAVAQKIG